MTKCLKSDFYRLFRGRALYIYLGLILVLSILTAVMNVPKFELSEAVMDGEIITVQSWDAFSDFGEIVYKDKPSEEQLRENKSVIMLESFEKIAGYAAIYTSLFVIIREFLSENDRVLIIDDFLAKGSALLALLKLVRDAGATVVGAGIVIEKAYQSGGSIVRAQGVRVESLARISEMGEDGVKFVEE